MTTPSPKYFCPRCRAAYDTPSRYCGQCGADMMHASGLAHAARTDSDARTDIRDADSSGAAWRSRPSADRRLSGPDPWLGRVVDNRYRVTEIIGRGGMGVVYKVEHQRMGKIAAMKVLHHDLAGDAEVIGRFHREAEAVSRLNHPNTVQVFDFGTTSGALYLIMEYVRGQDLGSLAKRDGPLPFSRAAPLFAQVCAALAEAHDLGIVHRDLKPENVLVTRTHGGRDFVKVLDFGLAKLTEREERADVTDRGSIVGTPYYMSPEQIRGEDVDARTDIYSLGALMYRVLTGEHCYNAKTPVGVLTKHLTAPLVLPSERRPELDIDPRIDALVARAMAKKREERFADVSALLEELEAIFIATTRGDSPSMGLPGLSWSSPRAGSQPAPRPGFRDDEVDYGIDSDIRLRRSDLDGFELSLRRRRIVRIALVPLMLAVVVGAVIYSVAIRKPVPQTVEHEPNNDLPSATLIAPDAPVRGFLGKRISKTEPDVDLYRVGLPAEPALVTVHATALPNIDLQLSLYDGAGKRLQVRDEGGVGHDEWIHGLRVTGPVFVEVTEAMPGPRLPTENVSDAYVLTVTTIAPAPTLEAEPNDGDAQPVRAGAPVTGFLDGREDVDRYRFTGPDGTYRLAIRGAKDAPLIWQVGDGDRQRTREATVTLRDGVILTLAREDASRPPGQKLPGVTQSYTLEIVR